MVREVREREQASWALIAFNLDRKGKKNRTGDRFSRHGICQMVQKAGIE